MVKFAKMLSPMKIGSVEIKNRVVMPAMCMGFGQINGKPTEELMTYYEERAKGGVGLIIPGVTRIDDITGMAFLNQLSVSRDENIEPLSEFFTRIHKHGAKIFIQLHHPGYQNMNIMIGTGPIMIAIDRIFPNFKKLLRKNNVLMERILHKGIGLPVVSPSKVAPCDYNYAKNRALRKKEIKKIIQKFIDGAYRVLQAGGDGVEIHAAHGYLLHQFFSPRTNQRNDEYGGSIENRTRIIREIVHGIKQKCGADFPITVRISADEGYWDVGSADKKNSGYTIETAIDIAKKIEEYGADALSISSGAYETMNYMIEPVSFDEGWRRKYVQEIRNVVKIPIIAANLIKNPSFTEQLLVEGHQDFVAIGRGNIADPYFVQKCEQNREDEVKRCICCLYCIETMSKNALKVQHGDCAVNPKLGLDNSKLSKNGEGRLVVVVGAGVAGLMAAETLLRRGFAVTILEKEKIAGGQLNLAIVPPKKEKLKYCIDDLTHIVRKLGGNIKYETIATKELINDFSPYAVLVATGGVAIRPKFIKGVDQKNVYTVTQILDGSVALQNKTIAVIGSGLTGLETSKYLTTNGNKVHIIEMEKEISPGTYMQFTRELIPQLKDAGVSFYPANKLINIIKNKIVLEDTKTKRTTNLNVDYVVLSMGVKPVDNLYDELKDNHKKVFKIGDASNIGRIGNAVKEAYTVASMV